MGCLENFDCTNRRLIETGTGEGLSVYYALKNGATEVWSVEECPEVHKTACHHLRNEPRAHLSLGRSVEFLAGFNDFQNSIVFLDAHFAGGADYGQIKFADSIGHPDSFPLLDELKILLTKDTDSAVIVIDDARIYYEDCPSVCPSLLRQWHRLPELEATLDKFTKHTRKLIGDEQGYVVLLPPGVDLSDVYLPILEDNRKNLSG